MLGIAQYLVVILQCPDESSLRSELQNLKLKHKKLRILYNKSLSINLQKDLKIQQLEQELNLLRSGECTQIDSNREIEDGFRPSSATFGTFSEYFDAEELQNLRTMQNHSRYDATFVRTALLYLYKGNPHILKFKSVRGSKSKLVKRKNGTVIKTEPREPLSPKKLNILKDIYSERIAAATSDKVELTVRAHETHFNQLIASSLSNIRRIKAK